MVCKQQHDIELSDYDNWNVGERVPWWKIVDDIDNGESALPHAHLSARAYTLINRELDGAVLRQ